MQDKFSTRSLVALIASGAIFAAFGIGAVTRGVNPTLPAADLLVTGDTTPMATVSDLVMDVTLTSDPDHSICASWLAKTGRLAAGCPLVATIKITNKADTPATNVVVTAPHPQGWDNPVVTFPTKGCYLYGDAPDLVCELGTLAAGASTYIVVEGDSDPNDETHTLSAIVTVESDGVDTTPESSAEAAILRVVPQADLSVDINPASAKLIPGEETTFTANVTNNGPSVAHGVRIYQAVTDPLSADFTDVKVVTSSGAPDGSCKGEFEQNNSTARCKVDDLAPGETATMVVTANIASDIMAPSQAVEVTVGVSSDTADTNNGNNNASTAVVTLGASSNLSIGTTGPHAVAPGERATWTMTVEDMGPSDSPNTHLELSIPDNLRDVVVTSDHGMCDLKGCDLGTLLASEDPNMPGNTVSIAITGIATDPADFMLYGYVTSATEDDSSDVISRHGDGTWEALVAEDDEPDNVTHFGVTVDPTLAPTVVDDEPQADIEITDFAISPLDATYTGPGSLRNIRFTATNNGPDPAHYPWFRLARSTDATTDLTDYPQFQGKNAWIDRLCQTTPREIMCALTDGEWLQPGESVTIDYNIALARMGRPGNYTDYLYVYSQTHDPYEANNYDVEDIVVGEGASALKVTVIPEDTVPNLGSPGTPGSVERPDRDPSFVSGDQFAYQITVEVPEADMADATGVTVTAELPPGFTATSARTASGQCAIGTDTVTCQIPVVAAVPTASSTQITISGHVDQNANDMQFGDLDTDSWAEQVPFTVTASSSTPTKDGSENTATATAFVDVIESADLELFVTPDQAGSHPDSTTIGYTLFALNLGPSEVEHAAFTAVIPEGYEFDAEDSNCVAPKNSEMDLDLDDVVDLVPTTTGFKVGAENAVVCKALRMRSNIYGDLEAGQAGFARIVLKRLPGAAKYGSNVEIVVGSLAQDPDTTNNALKVATAAPSRVITLSKDHPTGSSVPEN